MAKSLPMRILSILLLILICSCQNRSPAVQVDQKETSDSQEESNVKEKFPLQQLLNEAKLEGSLVVYDLKHDSYFTNDRYMMHWATVPASTFKITNSIIGLEMGLIDSSKIFKWDGEKRAMPRWEADLSLKQAFQRSCVPCYQELAREIGLDSMRFYLQKLNYGKMQVDSNNLDLFWLEGNSEISAKEQIDFITKLYRKELPLQPSTYEVMENLMLIEQNEQYTLYGKTGWAVSGEDDFGWFVGYIKTKKGPFIITSHLQAKKDFDLNNFPRIRLALCFKALEHLNIIKQ